MKNSVFCVFSLLLLLPTACRAEQDFYGIQMKNELWAQNLVLGTGPTADSQDLTEGPVLNHAIHAEASLRAAGDERLDFRVNVVNDSASEISSDYRYRDFFIYTKDGRKYSLIDENEDSRLNTVGPKSSRIFSPSLGNLKIYSEDVRMVSCSFDLGKTQIFLFPWSRKEEINRLTSPAPPPEPVKPSPPVRHKAKPSQDSAPLVKPAPVNTIPSVASVPQTQPSSRARLDQAIKNFVYKPASERVPEPQESAASPRQTAVPPAHVESPSEDAHSEAHVINVDKKYNFVTLNMGSKDGLKQNMAFNILRDGKTVAQAKVKQLRDRVAAAILLPGTVRSEVRPGDKIALV